MLQLAPCSQAPLCFCQITHLVISKPTAFSLFQPVWHFLKRFGIFAHLCSKKVVSTLVPRFWRQQIGWSYCAASWRFSLVAWRNLNKKVSLSCSQRAARSVVVMLQVWYAIALRFDSYLGDFPFLFSTFFVTFQTFPLCVTYRLQLAFMLCSKFGRGLAACPESNPTIS